MPLKIIAENDTLLVVDKEAGISVFPEGSFKAPALSDLLAEQFPDQIKLGQERRYGIAHRLDKDTSGILLIAKTPESFEYIQGQFQEKRIQKKYICLVVGTLKEDEGRIVNPLGRSPADRRKQKAFPVGTPGTREAITEWHVLQRFEGYTLLEIYPKTGRKHQIRAHLAAIHHPLAGDKLYGFKNQPIPQGLERQFLHASYIKIQLPEGGDQEFHSELPRDLQTVLDNLEQKDI